MNRLERWLDRLRAVSTSDPGWSTDEAPLVRALAAAAQADDGSNAAAVARVEPVALEAFRQRIAVAANATSEATLQRPAAPGPGSRPGEARGRLAGLRPGMPRRFAGLGAAMAAVVLAAASAVAGPTSPLYDVRVTWEEMTLPSDPDLRLAGEAERLDRRLAEAKAALDAGVPEGAQTALAVYASICRSISPAGTARAVAAFAVTLRAESQALERLRDRQDQVSAWVDEALRAAGGLEHRLRGGAGPPSVAGPPASPDEPGSSPAPAGGTGTGGGQPSPQASPAAPGSRGSGAPESSNGSGAGAPGGSRGADSSGGSGSAPSDQRTQPPSGPNPSGSGSPGSGSWSGNPASGQPGSTPRAGGSGSGAGANPSFRLGAGAVPTPSPSATPEPDGTSIVAENPGMGGRSIGGA